MTTIQTDQAARPDILEKLTYHRHERDDMTVDDCLEYLANRWKKIHGRPERALIMQITELLAAAPQQAVTASNVSMQAYACRIGDFNWKPYGHDEFHKSIWQMAIGLPVDCAVRLSDGTGIQYFDRKPSELLSKEQTSAIFDSLSTDRPLRKSAANEKMDNEITRVLSQLHVEKHNYKTNSMTGQSALHEAEILIIKLCGLLNSKQSTNQPVQAKALTDEQIKALWENYGLHALNAPMHFIRELLASQPSAQAAASDVRDARYALKLNHSWMMNHGPAAYRAKKSDLYGINVKSIAALESSPAVQAAPADVAAVRDAALEEAAEVCSDIARKYTEHRVRSTYEPLGLDASGCAYAIRALKSAAPTAQPQAASNAEAQSRQDEYVSGLEPMKNLLRESGDC